MDILIRQLAVDPLMLWFLVLAVLPSAYAESDRITCEGEGITRDAAVQAAVRQAVEKGVGVIIGSQTLSQNGAIVHDTIVARASGYVKHFAVVSEQRKGDTWTVRITTEVSFLPKLEQDMVEAAALLELKQYPRLMVIPDEIIDGKPAETWAATTALESFFLEKGIRLVDVTQLRENKRRELERAAQDPAVAAELGRQYGAEVVLTGYIRAAFSESMEPYAGLGVQHFYTANLNMKLVEVANARPLASTHQGVRAGSSTKEAGAQLAIQRAAEEIAPKLFLQTVCTWSVDIHQGAEYELIVIGVDDPTLERIRSELQGSSNVKGVTDATLTNGIGSFRVRVLGNLSDLKEIIRRHVTEPLTIENPELNRLKLTLEQPKVVPVPERKMSIPPSHPPLPGDPQAPGETERNIPPPIFEKKLSFVTIVVLVVLGVFLLGVLGGLIVAKRNRRMEL